jgi:hypothetical protein
VPFDVGVFIKRYRGFCRVKSMIGIDAMDYVDAVTCVPQHVTESIDINSITAKVIRWIERCHMEKSHGYRIESPSSILLPAVTYRLASPPEWHGGGRELRSRAANARKSGISDRRIENCVIPSKADGKPAFREEMLER